MWLYYSEPPQDVDRRILISACFTALASGTFLEISTQELIPISHRVDGVEKIWRTAFMVSGFGLMSLMAVLGA